MAVIEVGDRVLVDGKLGVVRYAGLTEFCSGFWYGIELDKCEGFNDGSVEGKRYFDMPGRQGNYGLFAQLEDLSKIDDRDGLREENRKLTGLVEALERKIRQLSREPKVLELQQTVKNLVQERAQRIEEQAKTVEENKQLQATIKLLQAGWNGAGSGTPGKTNLIAPANSTAQTARESDQDGYDSLNYTLKSDNDRLKNELDVVTKELSKLREDNRQYAALQAVYIDIEKELQDQLSTLENYILAEGGKSCGIAVESSVSKPTTTKAALHDQLYTALFPDDTPSLQLLELQYDILQRCFANASFDISIQDQLAGQLYFLILRELANKEASRSSSQCFDALQNEFGNNGIICSELLSGHFGDDMLRIRELIDFLKNSDSCDLDVRLVLPSMSLIFGEILPQLLSNHRKRNLSDNLLTSIGNVCSVSLSIEEQLKVLAEKVEVDSMPTMACHIRLSQVLEMVFSMIRYDSGSDAHPFANFKLAFEQILADLKQSETDSASAVPNHTEPLQAANASDSNTVTESSNLAEVASLESELSEKEARIEELAVKIQLLEIKLQESHTNLLQKDAETTGLPKALNKDDVHSDAQVSTGLKMDSSDNVGLHSPLTDSQLEALAKKSINSEILGLQRVVASLTKHQQKVRPNFSWLYEDERHLQAPTSKTHIEFRNKINDLTTSAMEVVEQTRIVNYRDDPTERQKNYLPNAVFKQNVLNLKIKDISA